MCELLKWIDNNNFHQHSIPWPSFDTMRMDVWTLWYPKIVVLFRHIPYTNRTSATSPLWPFKGRPCRSRTPPSTVSVREWKLCLQWEPLYRLQLENDWFKKLAALGQPLIWSFSLLNTNPRRVLLFHMTFYGDSVLFFKMADKNIFVV